MALNVMKQVYFGVEHTISFSQTCALYERHSFVGCCSPLKSIICRRLFPSLQREAVQMHSTKKPVTTMLTYPWKCTVLHCNHLGNTWKPLVLMTRHFDYWTSASEGDNQSVMSSAPVISRCFPGDYNVKLYISRGRLAWWLLAFLNSDMLTTLNILMSWVVLIRADIAGNVHLDLPRCPSLHKGLVLRAVRVVISLENSRWGMWCFGSSVSIGHIYVGLHRHWNISCSLVEFVVTKL